MSTVAYFFKLNAKNSTNRRRFLQLLRNSHFRCRRLIHSYRPQCFSGPTQVCLSHILEDWEWCWEQKKRQKHNRSQLCEPNICCRDDSNRKDTLLTDRLTFLPPNSIEVVFYYSVFLHSCSAAASVIKCIFDLVDYLVPPGRLLHEEMEDSEAQRLRGSTGLLVLLDASSSFSSSSSRKPLDRPERRWRKRKKIKLQLEKIWCRSRFWAAPVKM